MLKRASSLSGTAANGSFWLIRGRNTGQTTYDSDDVYVDYSGEGYYLHDRRYPGDGIAISFYVN